MTWRRIALGVLIAAGGASLVVSLWLPWYHLDQGRFLVMFGSARVLDPAFNTAWQEFAVIDWILAASGAYAILLGIALALRGWRLTLERAVLVAMPLLVSMVLIVLRVLIPPRLEFHAPPGVPQLRLTADYGPYLALAGLLMALTALVLRLVRDASAFPARLADVIGAWIQATGGQLSPEEIKFIDEVLTFCPTSHLWTEKPGRSFERLAVEGDADDPCLVCYFRSEVKRPGLMLAYEWPLRRWDDSMLAWSVWMANLGESLDEAGSTLPREPGPEGVARI